MNISNCATVIIHKITDPSTDTTTSFGYTDNIVTSPATTQAFSLFGGPSPGTADAQTKTIINVLPGTNLNVTENDPSGSNYTLTALTCTAGSTATNKVINVPSRSVTFDIAADETLECTFTNTKNKTNPKCDDNPVSHPAGQGHSEWLRCHGLEGRQAALHLWDNAACSTDNGGTLLYSEDKTVTANGDYVTANTGVPATSGYTITADGTYYWKVVYDGDTRNNTFTNDCTENAAVTLTPDP